VDRLDDFETFLARGLSPARARRETNLRITDIDAALGRGAYRRAERAHASHRGGKALHVLLTDGWHPARVYSREDRKLLAGYASALRRYADGDHRALDPFKGKTITTSLGRVKLLADGRTIAALERKGILRGQIDRLYVAA